MGNRILSAVWKIIFLLVACRSPVVRCWHAFDNTEYHCWDLTASATNTLPISCSGFNLRWVSVPGDTIKAQEEFSVTVELELTSAFYTWAFSNGYFDGIGSVASAADAETWCLTTACPADAKDATKTNCCIWHVNVHSCPLEDTTNGLCGPWISPSGSTFTHSDVLVGPVSTGNWTCYIAGLYQLGVTSLIAHFRIAGMQIALETKTNVVPRAECGDGKCEGGEGEDCESCPKDCGNCPLAPYALALIALSGFLIIVGIVAVLVYFQIQKRRMLWDESWIIPFEEIKEDEGMHGAFGSMLGSTMDLSTAQNSDGNNSMAMSAAKRQVFVRTAMCRGRNYAVRSVRKKEFSLTKFVRMEVRIIRECDHINICKFFGASIVVPNIRILTEYCPKGSLSDVLLNDDVPLNWAFRFSFAADVARGMQYLHHHRIYHGNLKSNNCVVDDRWTVKVTDFGLHMLRQNDEVTLEDDDSFEDDEDEYNKEKRAQIYKAPEFADMKSFAATSAGDVYAFGIILIEIATRNDPYGDEDAFSVPPCWRPPLPDLSPEMCESKDDICPCPIEYIQLIEQCWDSQCYLRPTFDFIKKTIHRINPNKLSPVDLMMAMMEKYSKHLESIVADRTQDLMAEKAKTDRLLYSMLPKLVADELRIGRPVEAKYHSACTIYFSDIVGFTTISGGSTAMQVVGLLNKLYITFDEIIDKYDVYKVETIGDAYMVVSGIPTPTIFHGREVADMSIDLVKACEVFTIPHMPAEPLKIRVGLHSGSACAGVVGLKMPRYCLFGDTVNTASRMESNGEAYKIHISNTTYEELIKFNKYDIEKRGTIPIKGKGEMITWWVKGYDPVWLAEREKHLQETMKNNASLVSVQESRTNVNNSRCNMSSSCTLNGSAFLNKNLSQRLANATKTMTPKNDLTSKTGDEKTKNGGVIGVSFADEEKSAKVNRAPLGGGGSNSNARHRETNAGSGNDSQTSSILNVNNAHVHTSDTRKQLYSNNTNGSHLSLRTTNNNQIHPVVVNAFSGHTGSHGKKEELFIPVELAGTADTFDKQRKISRISDITNDSGYADRSDDVITGGDASDIIVVRSCTSLNEATGQD